MSNLALASETVPRSTPASTQLWPERIGPSNPEFAQQFVLLSGTSSAPQNATVINAIISTDNNNAVGLLQSLTGQAPLSAGNNVVVVSGSSVTVTTANFAQGATGTAVNFSPGSGATANFAQGATGTAVNFSPGSGANADQGTSQYSGLASYVYQASAEELASTSAVSQLVDARTDALIAELEELRGLPEGWDGEGAETPIPAAIDEAISFVRSAEDRLVSRLEPTPDVDGSILLEIGDGSEGALRFRGDHTIVHAIRGAAPGIVKFDGKVVPEVISEALVEAAL
jgi:hypothetical protein